jgi:cell wall-associated NlpC family hydrolase
MHAIKRSKALPGDLVFYLGGGGAYHVAIYAGHGKQVSAADPAEGIKYQRIWGRNVQFRTNWH